MFDLLTASFAADGFQLRDDWEDREKELKSKHKVLRDLEGDDFLQVVALLATQSHRRDKLAKGVESDRLPGIGCKRKDILGLEVAEYRKWAPPSPGWIHSRGAISPQPEDLRITRSPYKPSWFHWLPF